MVEFKVLYALGRIKSLAVDVVFQFGDAYVFLAADTAANDPIRVELVSEEAKAEIQALKANNKVITIESALHLLATNLEQIRMLVTGASKHQVDLENQLVPRERS